ncbi:MAG: hypothetical protein R8L53_00700 [Mariprofundales bacterium]
MMSDIYGDNNVVNCHKKHSLLPLFALITIIFSLLLYWLFTNGYINDMATLRWSKVLAVYAEDEFRMEHLSLLYPHFPLYILIPFYFLPGLAEAAAPYITSILFAVILIVLWNKQLQKAGYHYSQRLLFTLLISIHPIMLWTATNGSHMTLSMLMFFLLYLAAQRIITEHSLQAYMVLGMVLAFYFYIDAMALFLFIALLPMLAIVTPKKLLFESPVSVYIITSIPFIFVVLSWSYMNWIFHGDAWFFLSEPRSAFLGDFQDIQHLSWLAEYGGEFFAPMFVFLGYMLLCYPIILYVLYKTRNNPARLRASFVMFLHPSLALAFATSEYFLGHPAIIMILIQAGVMAEMTLIPPHTRMANAMLVLFLALSVAGGWWWFAHYPSKDMDNWFTAVQGEQVEVSESLGDLRLGRWLDKNRLPTLMDHDSAYRVLVARGDADGMVLPFSSRFKLALRNRELAIEQVAIPDPSQGLRGTRDRINRSSPQLYDNGMFGYKLAYDRDGWRVYQRIGFHNLQHAAGN